MLPGRPCRGPEDFEALLAILAAGGRARNGSYYAHPGDVKWWLFYPDQRAEFGQRIALWDAGKRTRAACLFTPAEAAYDLFIQPELRGSSEAEAMEAWAEQHLIGLVRSAGGDALSVGGIAETDEVRVRWLEGRGYRPGDRALYLFTRSLEDVAATKLPDGFVIRPTLGEAEAESRALASYSAFKSTWPMDRYLARRFSFMRSPVFDRNRDMVVAAPDGRVAAFCIYWIDAVSQTGLFEPVGTHADFQRQGLGKALLLATLARMRAEGMQSARVCSYTDNPAAIRLYEAVGFVRASRLMTFERAL
jgi:mycothiol synthase